MTPEEFIGETSALLGVKTQSAAGVGSCSSLLVRSDLCGSARTTIASGGILHRFVEVNSAQEASAVLRVLSKANQLVKVLGAGSNLLIDQQGVRSWVLSAGKGFRTIEPLGQGRFQVGAALSLMLASRQLSEGGFSGIEFASGIPASLGGAVRMNAGAHGGAMSDIVESVSIATPCGDIQVLPAHELNFLYRHSTIPTGAMLIGAVLRLTNGDARRCAELRQSFLDHRKRTQPLSQPSFGSVFKNPSPALSAGSLIEKAGLKGHREGGMLVSPLHANWIVNPDRLGSSGDALKLIARCQEQVHAAFGITLEPEVQVWSYESC